MAKSRVNADHKERLEKRQQTKKQETNTMAELPVQKPFNQVPTWDSNETFEIKGFELESLYNFFNLFSPAITTVQQLFARGVQENKIKISYEYEDGTPLSQDEVANYTIKLQKYFAERQAEEEKKKAANEAPKSKIVSLTGEPVSQD